MRFGVLGTGYWAAEVHAAALAAHPDVELVGVWGRAPAKAQALADRFGVRAYADVDALLADVDAVAAALPPDVQAELAGRAAAAGRHLLLDKPIGLSLPVADRLVEAVQAAGVASVVFFTKRFTPVVEAVMAELPARGGWQSARAVVAHSIFQPGNPFGESPWRKEHGGLWDVGPHALSLVLPVLGRVERVAAFDGPNATTHVLLAHSSAAVSTISVTIDAPAAAVNQELAYTGEAGIIEVDIAGGDPLAAFASAASGLMAAAKSGVPHPCDVTFGREVVAILAAADTARRTGTVVQL